MLVEPFKSLQPAIGFKLRFLYDEAAKSVAIAPRWDTNPSQGTPQYSVRLPQQHDCCHPFLPSGERGTVTVSCLAK